MHVQDIGGGAASQFPVRGVCYEIETQFAWDAIQNYLGKFLMRCLSHTVEEVLTFQKPY